LEGAAGGKNFGLFLENSSSHGWGSQEEEVVENSGKDPPSQNLALKSVLGGKRGFFFSPLSSGGFVILK